MAVTYTPMNLWINIPMLGKCSRGPHEQEDFSLHQKHTIYKIPKLKKISSS